MIRNHDFHHAGSTLRSTVHVPDVPAGIRCPTVVFVHGFANNRIETGGSFVRMSRLLERDGIASVRFGWAVAHAVADLRESLFVEAHQHAGVRRPGSVCSTPAPR